MCRALAAAGVDADHLQLAEILWLADRLPQTTSATGPASQMLSARQHVEGERTDPQKTPPRASASAGNVSPPAIGVYAASMRATGPETTLRASRIAVPAAPALPNVPGIGRALKPLRRRYPSRTRLTLDEEATVTTYADLRVLNPVLRPELERWFDVALLVEDSASMVIWRQTCAELYRALARHGAFRDVRRWTLIAEPDAVRIFSESGLVQGPRALTDPSSRRLIVLVTDCVSPAWSGAAIWDALADWGRVTPVVLLDMLPERLWESTGLGTASVSVSSLFPGVSNSKLATQSLTWDVDDTRGPPPLPVVTLDERRLAEWAGVIVGSGGAVARGVRRRGAQSPEPSQAEPLSASQRVEMFRAVASPTAFELATYLSAVDLSLPVMRLVQRAMLPRSGQVHLAEFFLGGLIRRESRPDAKLSPDEVRYDFHVDVRELLQRGLLRSEALRVLGHVSAYLESRTGSAMEFAGLVPDAQGRDELPELARPFARIGSQLLAQYGFQTLARPSVEGDGQGTGGVDPPSVGQQTPPAVFDFLVSYAVGDRASAVWVAWHLEEANFNIVLRDWNMQPLDSLLSNGPALRNIVLLSETAVSALNTRPDWAAILDSLVHGPQSITTLARVQDVPIPETLADVGRLELVGFDERAARAAVQSAVVGMSLTPRPAGTIDALDIPFERRDSLAETLQALGATREAALALADDPLAPGWSSYLSGLPDRAAVYERILLLIEAAADSGYVQLVVTEGNRLVVTADRIEGDKVRYTDTSWDGIIGRCARELRTVWVPDVKLDSQYITAEQSTQSELAIAVVAEETGQLTGVLNLEWARPIGPTLAQIWWLKRFASQVGPAIVGSLASAPAAPDKPSDLWDRLRQVSTTPRNSSGHFQIPLENTDGPGVGPALQPGRGYFEVRLRELSVLSETWGDHTPFLMVVTRFQYGQDRVSVPVVLGPAFFTDAARAEGRSIRLLLDARVAGPYPYRGGSIDLAITLLGMPISSPAVALARALEKSMSEFDFTADLETYLRAAAVLPEGVRTLADTAGVRHVIGLETTFDASIGQLVTPHYGAVIVAPAESIDPQALWVRADRLIYGSGPELALPLSTADYGLYRIDQRDSRDDWRNLPFARRYDDVLAKASRADEADWQAAEADLQALVPEILRSPDLTDHDARLVVQALRDEMQQLHDSTSGLSSV